MKDLIKANRFRKHHFQLLELLVAAFILLICIAPTMRIFTSIYLSQQEMIRENQRDHLAHRIHAKFTEELYKRKISLGEKMQEQTIVLEDNELEQLLHRYSYHCEGLFWIESSRTIDKQENAEHLCQLHINMKDTLAKPLKQSSDKTKTHENPAIMTYDYSIYIDRKISNKADDIVEKDPVNANAVPQNSKPNMNQQSGTVKPLTKKSG